MIESKGPTNTRVYTVAVYFKGDRLAKAEGPSIQMAEMNAAKLALDNCSHLFPHLDYQKKIVERSLFRQNKDQIRVTWEEEVRTQRRLMGLDEINEECSKRNDERLIQIKKAQQDLAGKIRQEIMLPAPPVAEQILKTLIITEQQQQTATSLPAQPKKKKARIEITKTTNNDDDEEREEGECSDDESDADNAVKLVPY